MCLSGCATPPCLGSPTALKLLAMLLPAAAAAADFQAQAQPTATSPQPGQDTGVGSLLHTAQHVNLPQLLLLHALTQLPFICAVEAITPLPSRLQRMRAGEQLSELDQFLMFTDLIGAYFSGWGRWLKMLFREGIRKDVLERREKARQRRQVLLERLYGNVGPLKQQPSLATQTSVPGVPSKLAGLFSSVGTVRWFHLEHQHKCAEQLTCHGGQVGKHSEQMGTPVAGLHAVACVS